VGKSHLGYLYLSIQQNGSLKYIGGLGRESYASPSCKVDVASCFAVCTVATADRAMCQYCGTVIVFSLNSRSHYFMFSVHH
jgi:hypothetical protein